MRTRHQLDIFNVFPKNVYSQQKGKSPRGAFLLCSICRNNVSLRLLCVLHLLLFWCNSSFSQLPEEFDDICYDIGFRCATTEIDPIEGIYEVSTVSKILINNEVIKQQQSDGSLTIYSNSNGLPRDYNNKFEFYRIGRTQSYDVSILWPEYNITQHKRIRIEGTNFFNVTFSLTYEMPQVELRAKFGEYYVQGLKAIYTIHCKKILPDRSSVEQVLAVLKKRKETETKIWTGSGFSISNNMVVTNSHVIDKAGTVYITNEAINDTIRAAVIANDVENDIAVLSVTDKTLPKPIYSISKDLQKTGTNIFVLGYPLTSTMGNEIKATSGIISSQTGYKGNKTFYQISAPIQPGNSGGPVFDLNGNVIGIVCAHHTNAENVGYAIKTEYLMELLDKSHISINQQAAAPGDNNKRLTELIEQVKPNVFHVICINK